LTPLSSISVRGNDKIAKVLLENGANIEATNIYGDNALQLAAYSGHLELVKLMLDKGATMIADNDGWTPLNSAAERGHVDVVRVLLEHHADMIADNEGWTPLCSAANSGHLEVVKLLLEHGADMATNNFGWTPINIAARHGHLETVRLLLEYGADMVACSDGSTPLNSAADRGHLEIVKLLLEKDADMAVDNDGWTPLASAANYGHDEVVKLLLEKGADPTTASENGWTALTTAAEGGHLEVVQTLLEVIDDFDTVPSPYGSLWHIFAYKGYTDLLRYGHEERHVDLGIVSHLSHTCLQVAARKGHVETLQYLLSLNSVCPEEDAKGDGLLSYASSGGSTEIIKTLLEKTPEVPFTSRHWTPLHWACRASSAEVVELLIEAGFRSKCVALSEPEGQWSPLSVAIYHRNQAMLENLSEQSRSLIGAKDEDVQIQGKLQEDLRGEQHGTFWCSGCFHVSLTFIFKHS
jgi:ankyrin repeat protein